MLRYLWRKNAILILATALCSDAFALGKYDEFLVRKKSGSTALEVMASASVRVYKPGATVSSSTGSPSTVVPVYNSANLSGSDPIEIAGQTATIVTVDSAVQITLNTAVTFTKGDRILRTAQAVTIYEDPGGAVIVTAPATAGTSGRVIFFWDVASSSLIDIKASQGSGATYILADYPSVQSTAVTGSGSSVDNELVRMNGTSGQSVQGFTSNNPTCTDAGVCTYPGGITIPGAAVLSGTITLGNGTNADVLIVIDRSSTDHTAKWFEADGRFDFSQPLGATSFIFEGSTDAFETSLTATNPTADRNFVLPDTDGHFVIMKEANTPGSTIVFEGLIDDLIETQLFVAEPTGIDKSITFPNATGIIPLMLNQNSPGVTLVFDGATPDANTTTLVVTDPTAPRTIIFPNQSGTVSLGSATTCGTVAYNPTTLTANAITNDSVGVTGVLAGAVCTCLFITNPVTDSQVKIGECWGTTNVLNVRWYSTRGSSIDPASATLSYCCSGP